MVAILSPQGDEKRMNANKQGLSRHWRWLQLIHLRIKFVTRQCVQISHGPQANAFGAQLVMKKGGTRIESLLEFVLS